MVTESPQATPRTIAPPFRIDDFFDTFWNLAYWLCEVLKLESVVDEAHVFVSKDDCDVLLGQNVPFENATYLLKLESNDCATVIRSISVELVFESNLFDDQL